MDELGKNKKKWGYLGAAKPELLNANEMSPKLLHVAASRAAAREPLLETATMMNLHRRCCTRVADALVLLVAREPPPPLPAFRVVTPFPHVLPTHYLSVRLRPD
jgi:hypothetical protein